jgi:predicted aldo/keto reductase-like oxidoreductase
MGKFCMLANGAKWEGLRKASTHSCGVQVFQPAGKGGAAGTKQQQVARAAKWRQASRHGGIRDSSEGKVAAVLATRLYAF